MSEGRRTVLITGSNRGMGLEYARQYGEDGWRVIATCRSPKDATELTELARHYPGIELFSLDVSNQGSIDSLAQRLEAVPIDILLSNASHLVDIAGQKFGQSDYDDFIVSYEINALGPYRLANAFFDHVMRSTDKKMMFMGSTAGSISKLQAPVQLFGYCSAKAALHSMVRGLHLNLAPQGITVGLLEPGVVDTQGFSDVQPGEPAPLGLDYVVELVRSNKLVMDTPAGAVEKLRKIIDTMSPEEGGQLICVDGTIVPW